MNQEYKTKWINALRSGEYKQGKGALRNTHDKFCCLGVLYDIATKTEPEKYSWISRENDNHKLIPNIDPDGGICLPPIFAEEIDITIGGYINGISLWNMNDNEGKSFTEIADIIEREF